MKRKTFTRTQWLKKAFCFILAFAMVFSSMTITPKAAEAAAATEAELIAKTNPILKSYEVSDANSVWAVTAGTRFVVEATGTNIANDRLAEVVKLINAEFVEKEIASSNPHTMVYGPAGSQLAADIMIRIVPVENITEETDSDEAYKITINSLGVVIEAASEDAVMYALRTIETMMITNNGLVYGTITDWPDVAERRLHVDAGRKYFSKDWFIRQIREMSYMKLNTLQLHFAENLGFRIECETDPAIVSDEYLTKAEVKEILAEAEKYGIDVIPSLDTPGHVAHILKTHPEYGQVNTSGANSDIALDVTNKEAVEYMYSLYDEYMELFEGCKTFHIGGDEYMEFDRAPFTTEYQSVLTNYATSKWGSGYTWKDTLANYINELAAYVYEHGFEPRIYNDGIYYGENSSPQKIKMHDYIGVDFWSSMTWNYSIADLDVFVNKGHDLYNLNADYLYYILQSNGNHALPKAESEIYNTWTPGKFQAATISDDSDSIAGAAYCIWCDYPNVCDMETVHNDVEPGLRAFASKTWNVSSPSALAYNDFVALTEEIGNVAGYDVTSKLPEVGEFSELSDLGKVTLKYQDTKGNTIKADDVMYGSLGSEYSFTAPAIYLWIAESAEAVTGTYSETDGEIIFVYDIDPNPVMFDSDMATFPSVKEYVTTGEEFALTEASRFVIISSSQTLQNEVLENDLKLLSSEFTEVGLTDTSMNIVYGTDATPKAGDIVIRMDEASDDISPEAYTINIRDYAEVSATGEAGIFYGIRTIQKTMRLNDGVMDCGKITDEPGVEVRGMHLDAARKYFTKDWILALIKDLSYQNINTLQYHFSENEGYRLESSTLEAIDGWAYPSDGYMTKDDMLEIIAECQKYHIELVPSLDSPGHMTYVLNYLPDDWDCTSIWPGYDRAPQCFNIFQKEECKEFLKDLFTEYAEFFSEAGCKHINIGGDEFLDNFGDMGNDKYIIAMDYFNEISELVKGYGLTPRAWNDGLMYSGYSGYELDPDIEICYWIGSASCASVEEFKANGNKVINMSDANMYYVLGSWWMSAANPEGSVIYSRWHPGTFSSSARPEVGAQNYDYPYPDNVLGGSMAIWCDTPSMRTEDQIADAIFMRIRATAEKCWTPNTTVAYSDLESYCNKLGRVPGYDGSALPEAGTIYQEGSLGTIVLRYVDTDGNTLKNNRTIYGLIDDSYTITPEKLYGYRFVSMDKDAEGVYTEDEIVITLTYELYTDKTELQAAVDHAKSANNSIPATYAEYRDALADAKAVLADKNADQESVDAALEALTDAEKDVVALDRADLYLAVTYPVPSAGYTTASYSDYTAAISAAQKVLLDEDADALEIEEALRNVLMKKAALTLVPDDDMIIPTATDPRYKDYYNGTEYNYELMLDGKTNTYTWTEGAQDVGDEFKFTFTKPVVLNSFRYQAPADAGSDIFANAVVEISADGQKWIEIGTLKNETDKTIDAGGETVQYVKIRIVGADEHWVKIAEITFDIETYETVDKSALTDAIADAAALKKADYTNASWTVLETALANAEATNEKDDATAGEVAAAANTLLGSIEALELIGDTANVVRISGSDRYATGYKAAEALKETLGVDKFDAVVVATGKNFADALSGSYLAIVKEAPILLTNGKDDNVADLHAYIKENVNANGTVYILGGTAAVPAAVETIASKGYTVKRLAGSTRYETNLDILAEAGITGTELLVATGKEFADSLSASATGRPILLVKPGAALSAEQKAIAETVKGGNIYIVGGTGAVADTTAAELEAYAAVERIAGAGRQETSKKIAEKFFANAETVVLANAKNFPDGLCGGPLAAAMNAPLLLTATGNTAIAEGYVQSNALTSGVVLGGTSALSDEAVVDVFGLESASEIK